MSEETNNWEETIRSKFSGQHFPFDEENWEKAEAMIETKEKNRKRTKWGLIYLIGLASGIGLTIGVMKISSNDPVTPTAHLKIASVQNNSYDSSRKNSFVNVTPASHIHSPGNLQPMSSVSKTSGNSTNLAAQNSAPHHPSTFHYSVARISVNNNDDQKSGIVSTAVSIDSAAIAKEYFAAHPSSEIFAASSSSQSNDKDNNMTQNNVHPLQAISVVQSKSDSVLLNKITLLQQQMDSLLALRSDSSKTISAQNIPQLKKNRGNSFSLSAGGNFLLGWNYHDTLEARGLNPVAGLAITHSFDSTWSLRAGIRYQQVGHLHVSQNKITKANPGFGTNNSNTIITPLTLHYISFPVVLNKKINTKTDVGLGGSFSWLFNTTNRVETWNETDGNQLQFVSSKKQYGYFAGFNAWDAEVILSGRRQLAPRWSFLAEGFYGIRQIKNTTLYALPQNKLDHAMGIRFMLTYTLF